MERHFSRQFITDFINIYQAYPCLWQIKTKEYKTRHLRDDAYKQIIAFCRENGFPEANRDFVVKKIQSLRGSFRKEQKKVAECQRADEEYLPNLWYYHLLLFTKDQDFPADSSDMPTEEYNTSMDMPDSKVLLRRRIKTLKKVSSMRREAIETEVSAGITLFIQIICCSQYLTRLNYVFRFIRLRTTKGIDNNNDEYLYNSMGNDDLISHIVTISYHNLFFMSQGALIST